LRLWEIIVQRITVVMFGVYDRDINGTHSSGTSQKLCGWKKEELSVVCINMVVKLKGADEQTMDTEPR